MMIHRLGLAFILLVAVVCVGCVHEDEPEAFALERGDALLAFSVVTLTGEVVDNDSYEGRRGAVVFFSTACADCRRELPRLEEWYEAQEEDFLLVCISRGDDAETVAAFWAEYGLTMPVAADPAGGVYALFATRGIPRLFIVNDGVIEASYVENFPKFAYLKKHS